MTCMHAGGMHVGYIFPPPKKKKFAKFSKQNENTNRWSKASVQRINIYYMTLLHRNVATSCDKYFNGV